MPVSSGVAPANGRPEMAQQLIAIVNDNPSFLVFMQDLLAEEGYDGVFWSVGQTAYSMIRERMPQLVVLDIRMERPDSGLLILELLRLDPKTTTIPVIVCSADIVFLRSQEERLRALGCA